MSKTEQWERAETRSGSYEQEHRWLCHQVISQPNGPDRYTVSPTDATEEQNLTKWLTVNASCVVDLELAR